MRLPLLLTIFAVLALAGFVESSKILFLIAFPGKSQWLMVEPLINELLSRGHEVTAITNYEMDLKSKNYRSIIIDPQFDRYADTNISALFESGGKSESVFFKIKSLWGIGLTTTKFALESLAVKKFIETDRTSFDLVVSEQFQQEAFNMFSVKYNCPLVTLSTLDYSDFIDQAKGALTPWSHVPHYLSSKSDRMTFFERVANTAVSLYDALGRKFYYLPKQTELAREAFMSLENQLGGRLPSVDELEKKISVHLVNSHPALSFPRPKMPGLVDIAGIHIRKPKPLPQDIQKFLDGAGDAGAIYVSFGSFLKSSEMPPEKFQAMITVFKRIKQRVLWKWESDKIPDLPANVMVKKWLPQSDILAHKSLKLFIGHGGIFGAQEAIYYAVPMILYPFFGDQHLNAVKLEQRGVSLLRKMDQLSADSLYSAISTITTNQTFYKNIERMSEIFRTNQNDPLDNAVWWIEYVIKFKGAQHLQSPAKNLPWFRYLQLDLVFVIFGAIYIIYDLIKQLVNKADAKKSDGQKEKSEKKENSGKTKSKSKKKEN